MSALTIIEAPGKIQLWKSLLLKCGVEGEVIATCGHLARYPDDIRALGFCFRSDRNGYRCIDETMRRDNPQIVRAIEIAAARLKPNLTSIYIASDADDEGDVIAWDVARALISSDRSLVSHIRRLMPRTMTTNGMTAAIAEAIPLDPLRLAVSAIPGRSRAVIDRWIASALGSPGAAVGRVRNAVIGGIAMIAKGEIPRTRIETGEVTLRARCSLGERQGIARIACHERPPAAIMAIAKAYENNFVPGIVRPLLAAGAMPVTRVGRPNQPGIDDILIIAARHHGIAPVNAMEGLQKAYLDGLISYPRVTGGEVGAAAYDDTRRMAGGLGLKLVSGEPDVARLGHDPLHPVLQQDGADGSLAWWRQVLYLPEDVAPAMDPVNGLRDRMASIVARRAIEAALPATLVSCSWDADGSTVRDDWRDTLTDLDWVIETGPRPSWPRSLSTGARTWPAASQLIEFMAAERLGRPSTLADHAHNIASSGDLVFDPWEIPRLQPSGAATINGPGSHISRPSISRRLEEIMRLSTRRAEDLVGATGELNLAMAIGDAVLHMVDNLDPETRRKMFEYAGLDSEKSWSPQPAHSPAHRDDEPEETASSPVPQDERSVPDLTEF